MPPLANMNVNIVLATVYGTMQVVVYFTLKKRIAIKQGKMFSKVYNKQNVIKDLCMVFGLYAWCMGKGLLHLIDIDFNNILS